MPIPVACQCGARFAAQDHLAGKAVRCPKCQQPLKIPAPAAAPKAPAPAPPSTGVGSILDEVGVAAVQGMRCPQCGNDVPVGAVICVKCGYDARKGKGLRVEGDKQAAKRHDRVVERQRVAAERQAAKVNAVTRVGYGTQTDIGGVPEATTAIVRYPTETFQRLSTIGGTKEAYGYAVSSALFISILWIVYFTFYVFALPVVAAIQGNESASKDLEALLPYYGQALAYYAGFYAFMVFVSLCVAAPAMAAGTHLIVRFVGNSPVGYFASLRVYLYIMGAHSVVSGLPCISIITPIITFVHAPIAIAVHHRVPAGVAILGYFLGMIFGVIAAVLFYFLIIGLIAIYLRFQYWITTPEGSPERFIMIIGSLLC